MASLSRPGRLLLLLRRVFWHMRAALRRAFWPCVELFGAGLLVACLAFFEPRLAVGLAGVILIVAANFRNTTRPPREPGEGA